MSDSILESIEKKLEELEISGGVSMPKEYENQGVDDLILSLLHTILYQLESIKKDLALLKAEKSNGINKEGSNLLGQMSKLKQDINNILELTKN